MNIELTEGEASALRDLLGDIPGFGSAAMRGDAAGLPLRELESLWHKVRSGSPSRTLKEWSASCRANSERWWPSRSKGMVFQLMLFALGINGEAGEVAELIKKAVRETNVGHSILIDREHLSEELVDVLTYVFVLAGLLDLDLDEAFRLKTVECERRFQERSSAKEEVMFTEAERASTWKVGDRFRLTVEGTVIAIDGEAVEAMYEGHGWSNRVASDFMAKAEKASADDRDA